MYDVYLLVTHPMTVKGRRGRLSAPLLESYPVEIPGIANRARDLANKRLWDSL